MKIRQNAVRALAATALGLTVTAGTLATASGTASAASLSERMPVRLRADHEDDGAVNLRSGPGTKYTSLGILQKGTRFTYYCDKDLMWFWGPVGSGANKGRKGWVSTYYLAPV
ncbi:SH3 domain-containing protein [Streptomyces sp. NPDC054804]